MVANYRHIEYWMVATKQTIIVKIKNWEIGVSVHFISFFLKPIDDKLIVEGI